MSPLMQRLGGDFLPTFLAGMAVNFEIAVLALLVGLVVGAPLAFARVSGSTAAIRGAATIIGLMPMAIKLGTGSEAYAPLARAIIGGMSVSLLMTVFIVPAAYLLVYRNREAA